MKYRELSTLIISLITVVVALGLYGWWYQTLENTKERSAATRTEIQTFLQQAQQGKQQLDGAGGIEATETLLASHLVKVETVVGFLQHLEEVGRAQGVFIEVSSVSDTAETGKISVAIKATGSFQGMMRTLGALENDQYALFVKNVTLTSRVDEGWEMVGIVEALTYVP